MVKTPSMNGVISPDLLTSIPFLAILAPIVLMWNQLKELIQKIIRLFIIEVKVDGMASQAITYYLAANAKSLPTNILRFDTKHEYVVRKKSIRMILMQILAGLKSQLFWHRHTLVSLSDLRGQDKETNMMTEQAISIRFLRGTLNHERLMLDAIDWYEKLDCDSENVKLVGNFYMRRCIGSGRSREETPKESTDYAKAQNGIPTSNSPYQSLRHNRLINYQQKDLGYAKREFYYVFNETSQRVHDDVVQWHKSKDWYQSKGLLHRRGALMHGKAESGKTAAIRKIAQELDLPLYLFELNTMTDKEFIDFWDNSNRNGSAMVVFEDIDCTFKKRENISKGGKLSFECVLNCISGVIPSEGVYLFVTTNRLDYLDEALGIPNDKGISTRPGRLDTCFEIGDITEEQKATIASHFLGQYPYEAARIIKESNGCTAAQFSDMCSQKALELYWTKTT